MHFEQAVELAEQVRQLGSDVELLAIGRFLPPEDVRPDTPWMVSFKAKGWARPGVLRSPADIDKLKPKQPEAHTSSGPGKNSEPMLF